MRLKDKVCLVTAAGQGIGAVFGSVRGIRIGVDLAGLAIAGGLAALLREMAARERARQALDAAHEQVALRERELSGETE